MPDANRSVVQRGQQMRAVGREGHPIHGGSWLSQRQNFTTGGNVPEMHGIITTPTARVPPSGKMASDWDGSGYRRMWSARD